MSLSPSPLSALQPMSARDAAVTAVTAMVVRMRRMGCSFAPDVTTTLCGRDRHLPPVRDPGRARRDESHGLGKIVNRMDLVDKAPSAGDCGRYRTVTSPGVSGPAAAAPPTA
ncbi:hypothetical protein GCM10009749_25380 [Agromyces neolithicus]|uniref:Uncharacterized protein n=1 Tax=Agromyces neolithicus TaxID=269420 RepID=A0ABP4YKV5_9MICO